MKNVFVLLILSVSLCFSTSHAADATSTDTTFSASKTKLHPVTGEMFVQVGFDFVEVAKFSTPFIGSESVFTPTADEDGKSLTGKTSSFSSQKTPDLFYRRSRDGLSYRKN